MKKLGSDIAVGDRAGVFKENRVDCDGYASISTLHRDRLTYWTYRRLGLEGTSEM